MEMDHSKEHTPTIDDNQKKEIVRKHKVFTQLTEQELDGLSALFKEVIAKPGETVVTEGDHVDSVYLIISGNADVRHVTIEDGKPKIQSLATLGPGMAIGLNETGFYSLSGIRTATVVANSEMVMLRLSMAAFHGFALANSHVNEVMRKNANAALGQK